VSKVKCHNCGGDHYLRDGPDPKDQGRIDANQKKMKAAQKLAKKGKKDGKGKDSKSGIGLSSGRLLSASHQEEYQYQTWNLFPFHPSYPFKLVSVPPSFSFD
jgi:hypothetical protein